MATKWPCFSAASGVLLLLFSSVTSAQCENTISPSCDVYQKCFAKYCPCPAGPAEYFKSYGEKYCMAFLANANFTDAGKKWRDSTLRCLQETIVPRLDISENPVCDCGNMRDFAFDAHVACYTQKSNSICDLGKADKLEIVKTIGIEGLFDSAGWRQMYEVVKVCTVGAQTPASREEWKRTEADLKERLE